MHILPAAQCISEYVPVVTVKRSLSTDPLAQRPSCQPVLRFQDGPFTQVACFPLVLLPGLLDLVIVPVESLQISPFGKYYIFQDLFSTESVYGLFEEVVLVLLFSADPSITTTFVMMTVTRPSVYINKNSYFFRNTYCEIYCSTAELLAGAGRWKALPHLSTFQCWSWAGLRRGAAHQLCCRNWPEPPGCAAPPPRVETKGARRGGKRRSSLAVLRLAG
ncbi:hypothetical protein U0070_001265 [Myodes glareolus]|uniref:Uncharacterized protein n=1 Tax=Myodes glareolus TaxID=447135 RepID=A0AAW0HC30_MYOGA